MTDRVVYIGGNPVKLIDNGDGTFSIGTSADVTVNADVSVTGSIAEYMWDASDPNPDPGANVRAFGVKHDAGVFTPYYWDGTSWEAI